MEKQSNVEKLSAYIILIGVLAVIGLVCWYFSNVLVYIVLAFVVSLVSRPIMGLLSKIRIKGKSIPRGLLAILSIIFVLSFIILIVTRVIPVIVDIFKETSIFNETKLMDGSLKDTINGWVAGLFNREGTDYDAIGVVLDYMKSSMSDFSVTGLLGSVAETVVDVAVGLFSVVFISFFFVKDSQLFGKIAGALVPDRLEASVKGAISDIEHLLSRYFIGIFLEMLAVALFNFLGLWLIARVGISYALGIAFIAGILNIIPYVGPLIGEVLGTILCVVLKYGTGIGLDVNIWIFGLIVLLIMLTVQLIDNFVLQPVIYSTSIQATPLEIFIVILMASHIGGVLGMLAAIPAYTVIRVVAGRFFYDKKIVRRLMPDIGASVD